MGKCTLIKTDGFTEITHMIKNVTFPLISLCTFFAIGCQGIATAKTHQANSQFSVQTKCVSSLPDDASVCTGYNVVKTNIDGSSLLLMENYPKEPIVKKLSENLYQVKYSCGNYCRAHEFWSATKSDSTDTLVAFNPQNQCLVEYDFNDDNNVTFTARKLFSQNEKVIYTGVDMYASVIIDEVVNEAKFVSEDLEMQLLGNNWKEINIKIKDVCK